MDDGAYELPPRRGALKISLALFDAKAEARFWAKVDKGGPVPDLCPHLGPCWDWKGTVDKGDGYGRFRITVAGVRVRIVAHRVAWLLVKRRINHEKSHDHLCRRRGCVNPDHQDPVTHLVNVRRGVSITAQNYLKVECKRGHPFAAYGRTVTDAFGQKRRRCRVCDTLTSLPRKHKWRAKLRRERCKRR